jgi:hypothetical protein
MHVNNEQRQRQISTYMNNILANYNRSVGKKGTR